jgi:hypothetical protein
VFNCNENNYDEDFEDPTSYGDIEDATFERLLDLEDEGFNISIFIMGKDVLGEYREEHQSSNTHLRPPSHA